MHAHASPCPTPYEPLAALPAGLVDPRAPTLAACTQVAAAGHALGRFVGSARVAVAPFAAVTIHLDDPWAPTA